jgi:hypothetical protein
MLEEIYLLYVSNTYMYHIPRSGSFDIVRKNLTILLKFMKNNDRGANKSLIIHKTSQNNRNNII